MRVLIVDDKPDNLYLLRALLQGHGYVVDEARHGAEALVKARQAPPQLVISDLLMPVMDGYTLLRHWKSDERLKAIPFVVYTTTYTEPEDEQLALDLGADAFILKPVEPAPFMARIEVVLATQGKGELVPARAPAGEESVLLKEYSEALIRKLEDKALQLEQANRALQEDIARREQAEVALRESGSMLRKLIDGLGPNMFVGLMSPDGVLLEANRPALAAAGLTTKDVVGKQLEETYWLSWSPQVQQQIRAAIVRAAAGEASRFDLQMRVAEGQTVWIDYSLQPLRDDSGRIAYLVPSAMLIEERKQAEVALRESEQRLRLALDATHMGTFDWDVPNNRIAWSRWHEELWGFKPGEFGGTYQAFAERVHPADSPGIDAEVARCIAARASFTREFRVVWPDGSVHWIHARGEFTFEGDGRPTRMRGTVVETTEQKRVEEALRESEARYRAMVEWSPDAISVQRGGRLLYVNPAAIRMFGASSAQDLIGKSILDLIHPDFHQIALARMKNFTDDDVAAPMIEERFLKLDGTPMDVEVQGASIVYDGAPAVHIAARDITGRKQAEAARASLEAQLRESQKMEAIGTLAGGIAHDFNNILAAILGNAELAREDVSTNPQALESVEEILKAGQRARNLVRQILSFSRRQPTERKLTALAPVIEESVRLLRATLPARLVLAVRIDADLPAVLADATQIEQVVINLVTNAMHAMHGEPGCIGIRLDTVMLDAALADAYPALGAMHARHPGRTLRLAVSDDGPGMDAATLGRIFEPFFTTKPVGEGTGLGLSVVQGIVQAHEGTIAVDSQPGKGAAFTLYMPVAEAQSGASEPDESVEATAVTPDMGGGRHILYLDDDESLVFLVTRLLERRGFRISGYIDPREALEALRAEPTRYDLVVTDYNMPGMSGLDVARAVRVIRADLAVAVVSGFIDETLRALADGAGVRELIFKASAVEDLCEAFERLAMSVGEK